MGGTRSGPGLLENPEGADEDPRAIDCSPLPAGEQAVPGFEGDHWGQRVRLTTVADSRLAAEILVSCSGSVEQGIGIVFAIATSAVDAQRRAIRAREGK